MKEISLKAKKLLYTTCIFLFIAIFVSGCISRKKDLAKENSVSTKTAEFISNKSNVESKNPSDFEKIDNVDAQVIDNIVGVDNNSKDSKNVMHRDIVTKEFKVDTIIRKLGYESDINVTYKTKIKLPESFTSFSNKVAIGNFLLEKNNQSKEFGFDFSSYMGKELLLYEIQILKDNTKAGVIIFFLMAMILLASGRTKVMKIAILIN